MHEKDYAGSKVLITGGAGFIGSALARRLVKAGATVTIVDNLDPDHGGNLFNLADVIEDVRFSSVDIRDAGKVDSLVSGQDFLFSLAAQTSHVGSMQEPGTDVAINVVGQMNVLEACRKSNPNIRIIFASTRQVYGVPDYLPVDENHPIRPPDVNGISKAAAEQYQLIFDRAFGIRSCILRLTNTYGPGMRIRDAKQTLLPVITECGIFRVPQRAASKAADKSVRPTSPMFNARPVQSGRELFERCRGPRVGRAGGERHHHSRLLSPLLNALINACNQKNNREPVMNLDEGAVRQALDGLQGQNLAGPAGGADSRVTKYEHRLQEVFNFNRAETAVMCVLLLRGPQTPGELRGRAERMHRFEALDEVQSTLQRLMQREPPIAKALPRQPGTKETRYMHLLSGDVEEFGGAKDPSPVLANHAGENEALMRLENEVHALRKEVDDLKQQFESFRKTLE